VKPFDLGLADGIAEGDEQNDGKRAPDDAGQGQAGPKGLADEVPDQVAKEDADHRIT
jgi:hypothetical protein